MQLTSVEKRPQNSALSRTDQVKLKRQEKVWTQPRAALHPTRAHQQRCSLWTSVATRLEDVFAGHIVYRIVRAHWAGAASKKESRHCPDWVFPAAVVRRSGLAGVRLIPCTTLVPADRIRLVIGCRQGKSAADRSVERRQRLRCLLLPFE